MQVLALSTFVRRSNLNAAQFNSSFPSIAKTIMEYTPAFAPVISTITVSYQSMRTYCIPVSSAYDNGMIDRSCQAAQGIVLECSDV